MKDLHLADRMTRNMGRKCARVFIPTRLHGSDFSVEDDSSVKDDRTRIRGCERHTETGYNEKGKNARNV